MFLSMSAKALRGLAAVNDSSEEVGDAGGKAVGDGLQQLQRLPHFEFSLYLI